MDTTRSRPKRHLARAGALAFCALMLASGSANADVKLKAGGVPVDFVRWSVEDGGTAAVTPLASARARTLADQGNDIAILRQHIDVMITADGSVEVRKDNVYSVLTRLGVDEGSDVPFGLNAHTSTVDILAAHTLTTDGRRVSVAPESVQVRTWNDASIFTNAFEVIVPYAAVEPGASLVLSTVERFDASRSPVPWSDLFGPRLQFPVEDFRLRVRWAKGATVPRIADNLDSVTCSAPGDRERLCTGKDIEPFSTNEMSFQPADLLPHIAVSLVRDWDDLSALVRSFTLDKLTGGPAVQARFAALDATGTPRQRLEAIHRFVARKIRYLGLEQEEGAYVPRPASHTLERGYGDCKDKTVLFLDLARQAGLDAWPVLVSTRRSAPGAMLTAAPAYFDHMIACADVGEAEPACVDLTDSYAPAGTTSAGVAGAVILPLRERGAALGALDAPRFMLDIELTSEVALEDGGAITDQHDVTYEGDAVTAIRARVANLGTEQRDAWGAGLLADVSGTEENASDLEFEGLDLDAMTLAIRGRLRNPTPFDAEDTPSVHRRFDWPLRETLRTLFIRDESAGAVAITGVRMRSEYVITDRLVPRTIVNSPLTLRSDFGTLSREAEQRGSDLHITTTFEVPRQTIGHDALDSYKSFLDRVARRGLVAFLLAEPSGSFDSGSFSGGEDSDGGDQ